MKIILFGPTGGVGRCLLEQALAQGHRVTAFARDPAALAPGDPRLSVVQGDAFDGPGVAAAIAGHDAVLCALGAGRGSRAPVCSVGTGNVVRGMRAHGVRRLVCASAYGVGDSLHGAPPPVRELVARVLHDAFAEKAEQERVVRESGLDWVIVRAVGLRDAPPQGRWRSGVGLALSPARLPYMARADVAAFMLRQLSEDGYLRQAPTVAAVDSAPEPAVAERVAVAFRGLHPASHPVPA